jgi:hypothetical protein
LRKWIDFGRAEATEARSPFRSMENAFIGGEKSIDIDSPPIKEL